MTANPTNGSVTAPKPEPFTLAGGGILYRILPNRLIGSPAMRIGVILVAWVVLLILCAIEGTALGSQVNITFLSDPRRPRFFSGVNSNLSLV